MPRGADRRLPAHSRKCYNVQTGKGNGTLKMQGTGTSEQGEGNQKREPEKEGTAVPGLERRRTAENRDDIESSLVGGPSLSSLRDAFSNPIELYLQRF
jgi:hypothetical protein